MTTLTFTASGSWTAAAASVDCQNTAEGGGGGVRHTSGGHNFGGGGGGGAEYSEETALALTIGSNYPYTIGTGGSSTNTVFAGDSVTVTAHFGATGFQQSGGAGGSGSTNTIHFSGTAGTPGTQGSFYPAGPGGAAAGPGGTGTGGAGGTAGADGTAPGGGGGGGSAGGIGSGAAGQIVIIYSGAVTGTAAFAGAGTLTAQGGPAGIASLAGIGTLTATQAGSGHASLAGIGTLTAHAVQRVIASLAGAGTMTAFGSGVQPAVVNQWANSYGQGTTFTSITSSLQSCVVPLTPAFSAGTGSGTPTAGNWLFAISSWTQDPSIINVHVGTGDDIRSYWREYPAAGPGGLTRTAIAYTPNIARAAGNVYVAPDGEIAAVNVLVVEVSGLGPWDTVVGTVVAYDAAATTITLSHAAGASATFFIGATGGDNVSSGQAFLPSGWTGLATQTQGNGVNDLADNILTAAFLPSSNSTQSVSGSATTAENLSGFMLAVLTTGTSPIPANQNPNWPHVIFEAGFGSGFNTPDSEVTWTALPNRLWSWDETTGIKFNLGQLQSTDLTLEIDNYDAALTSTNASSPYYPDVQPGTPLRVRAALGTLGGNVVNRWYVIQRNAAQWGEAIDEAYRRYCEVAGTDLWAALSATPPSFYRAEVYEDGPYAWWPCDDQPGNSGVLPTYLLNAAVGNTNVLNIKLSPLGGVVQAYLDEEGRSTESGTLTTAGYPPGIAVYTVGASAGWMFGDPQGTPASLGTGNPVTSTPGSAAWQASGQAGSTGSYGWYLICDDSGFPALSGGATIECWFNAGFYGSANGWTYQGNTGGAVSAPITAQPYNSPVTIWEIATSSAPVCLLQLDASGHLNLITAGTSHSIYTSSDLRSDSWHMVTVTLTTSGWAVWLDGGANATVSGSASMTSAWTYFVANGDFGSSGGNNPGSLVHGGNISLSHIAVYPSVLPYYRVLDHYWAAVSAFGVLPAPAGVQVAWTNEQLLEGLQEFAYQVTSDLYVPDGSAGNGVGGYDAATGTGISVLVEATAPGGIVSGPSAWLASTTSNYVHSGSFTVSDVWPWVSWTGVAPLFNVYTSANLGSETESAVVNGGGDSFTGGYGGSAAGAGVAQVSGGNGSSPPSSPSAIGDTVGQRIERLMRAGLTTSPNRCIDPASLLVQAPGDSGGGVQAGAAIQAIQQSDSGFLAVDNLNNLFYWQRSHLASQYSSPVWKLGPDTGSGQTPYYPEIRWITDPQHVYNAIAITPLSPTGAALPEITPVDASAVDASQEAYGAQPLAITSWLQSSSEQQSQANWLFSVYGTPQRRAERVKIDAAPYPAAWELVMGVNVGDVVTLEDWVIGGGGTVHTYRVTELQRVLSFGTHGSDATGHVVLTLDVEPVSYWE